MCVYVCMSSRLECFSNFLPSSFVQRKTIKMVNLRVCVWALWGTNFLLNRDISIQHAINTIQGKVWVLFVSFVAFLFKAFIEKLESMDVLYTHTPTHISKKNYNFFQLTFLIIAIRITGFNVKPKNSNCWPSIMTSNISVKAEMEKLWFSKKDKCWAE